MTDTTSSAHEKLTLRVQSITYAAKDTYLVELTDPQGTPLPSVTPDRKSVV